MAARYKLAPDALNDLAEIRLHYLNEAGATVARRVLGELGNAFAFLARTPGAGHKREDLTGKNVRFWPVFSYMIVYDPTTKPLAIVRVLHGNRDLVSLLQR